MPGTEYVGSGTGTATPIAVGWNCRGGGIGGGIGGWMRGVKPGGSCPVRRVACDCAIFFFSEETRLLIAPDDGDDDPEPDLKDRVVAGGEDGRELQHGSGAVPTRTAGAIASRMLVSAWMFFIL